mgnify:FL=1
MILFVKNKFMIYLWTEFTNKIPENMFEFSQYLGFLLFLTILTIGFWLMFFLVGFVQYWIGGSLIELYKEKKAKKLAEQEK